MGTIFRFCLRIFLALSFLAGLCLFVAYHLAGNSVPDYDADHSVPDISAPVEIVRNNAGVPHIFGAQDGDVFYGLGFVHAQDRLWQMLVERRKAQGRMAAVFGPEHLKQDITMRRLDLFGAAQRAAALQDDDTKAALQAYANGVNAWLRLLNDGALGRGAPEFWLFSPEVPPWEPADSIALQKLMAYRASAHIDNEALHAQLLATLPAKKVAQLLPEAPGKAIGSLNYAGLMLETDGRAVDFAQLSARHFAGASNAFAADTNRSAAGGTLLASDPHSPLTAPSVWYLARLELQSGGVIGATIPGLPVIYHGRSEQLGWGMTTAHVDDQDLYLEQIDPDDPARYFTEDGVIPFRTRPSRIRVDGAQTETIDLRWTRNGPVISGLRDDIDSTTPRGHVVSLSATYLSEDDTSVGAMLKLMQTKTVDDALTATTDFVAPAQNLVLADLENVAMKTIGAVPDRDPDHATQGRFRSPGWEPRNRWRGLQDYGDLPEFRNPPGGIVGNTNNKTTDAAFPDHLSFDYGDTQRVQRWQELMLNRQIHTRASFVETQLDTISYTAQSVLRLIAADLWFTGEAAEDGTRERQRQRALDLLAQWNGEMSEHLPEPLIFSTWLRQLQAKLLRDDLGPMIAAFDHPEPVFLERVFRGLDNAAEWCDIRQSAPVETCSDLSRIALDEALIWLEERYGRNIESWRWGDAHEAIHRHEFLGNQARLAWFVNITQSTSGGDNTLARGLTSGVGSNPFQNVQGAGYRGVYDFADPDSSVFIISTGQSGHPLSRHYDDLGDLWRRGEYIPMTLNPDLARAASVGTTTLTPR